jgi:glutaryl-CoA dehydrogenase
MTPAKAAKTKLSPPSAAPAGGVRGARDTRADLPDPFDFYDIAELLSEEERLIRQTVRDFVEREVRPDIEEHFRAGTFPRELVPRLAALGILGPTVPEAYGGAGLDATAQGLIMLELERGDSGLRSFASVQGSLVMHPILRFGSEEQREHWLPRLTSGQSIGCFGLTEPDHGSDPGGMETRAVRRGDRWRLNGRKMWITSGGIADLALVWAKTDEADAIAGFLVETKSPGFSTVDMHNKWSMRASVTSELILEEVEVPESSRLPGARGLAAPLSCLNQARYGIAWGAIGAALACFESARRHALERTQFGRPIGGFQLVQAALADMLAAITQAELLCLRLGRLKEAGRDHPARVSLAKRQNVAMALEVARSAREILGAIGITGEVPVMRHLMNLETVKTYEGTHQIHTLILGQAVTGIDAFR